MKPNANHSHSRPARQGGRFNRRRHNDDKQRYRVQPVLPEGKDFNFTGRRPHATTLSASSAEDALRRACVSGFIPSNTVLQYYEAVAI